MKKTDKMRMLAIALWITGGAMTLRTNPEVSLMTIASGLLFGAALFIELKEK